MLLIIDNSIRINKSSYIHKLKEALNALKIPYHEVNKINVKELESIKSKVKGIIISGSKIKLSQKTLFTSFIHDIYYLLNIPNIPILGLCFGSQILHLLNDGKLKNRKEYLCEIRNIKLHENHKLFDGLDNSNEYINPMQFCFSDLILPINNEKIKEIAWLKINNKEVPCGFEYKKNVFGLLFHPEVLESSWKILDNFAKLSGIKISNE